MALGLGFGCCCQQCALLQNCDTEATITTTSDLSAYSVGDVLRRDASEGGGCWELLSLTAQCGDSPETFTVDGDPYTGETACADCLADVCICCGESCAERASGTWGFFILNDGSSQGESCLEDIPLAFGGSGWAGSSTDCGITIEFTIYCLDGDWVMDVQIGSIVNMTEVPVQGPGSWSIYWTDSQADYRGTFGCCPDIMEVPADSVGISVVIPGCPE